MPGQPQSDPECIINTEEQMNDGGRSGGQCLLGCPQRLQFKSHNHNKNSYRVLFVLCDLFVTPQSWPCTSGDRWQMPVLTWPHHCPPFVSRVNREFFKLHYPDANDIVASPGPVPGQVVKQSIHSGKQDKNKQIRDKSWGKQIIFLHAQPRMVPYLNAGKNQRRTNQ